MAHSTGGKVDGGKDSSRTEMFMPETFRSGSGLAHDIPEVCPCESIEDGPKVVTMKQWEEDEE